MLNTYTLVLYNLFLRFFINNYRIGTLYDQVIFGIKLLNTYNVTI